MRISACLIACNEEENLPRCLASIAPVVDEIVVVDSGSTDRTREIAAKDFGARVLERPWEGFVAQKNFALAQATHPWVLSIDGDEELSPGLQARMVLLRRFPRARPPAGYAFSRVVCYQGQWIWHGDWYPDILVRLFQRDRARFAGARVHERLELDGCAELLSGHLHHFTYRDRDDRSRRIERYARLWAESARERGRRSWPWSPPLHAAARFIRGYVLRCGWLDGPLGWEIAAGNAREAWLKYRFLRRPPPDG
jgi:glycosyltransferase involved in cell wall biosynthesis